MSHDAAVKWSMLRYCLQLDDNRVTPSSSKAKPKTSDAFKRQMRSADTLIISVWGGTAAVIGPKRRTARE